MSMSTIGKSNDAKMKIILSITNYICEICSVRAKAVETHSSRSTIRTESAHACIPASRLPCSDARHRPVRRWLESKSVQHRLRRALPRRRQMRLRLLRGLRCALLVVPNIQELVFARVRHDFLGLGVYVGDGYGGLICDYSELTAVVGDCSVECRFACKAKTPILIKRCSAAVILCRMDPGTYSVDGSKETPGSIIIRNNSTCTTMS